MRWDSPGLWSLMSEGWIRTAAGADQAGTAAQMQIPTRAKRTLQA